jgi:hypothetical protein
MQDMEGRLDALMVMLPDLGELQARAALYVCVCGGGGMAGWPWGMLSAWAAAAARGGGGGYLEVHVGRYRRQAHSVATQQLFAQGTSMSCDPPLPAVTALLLLLLLCSGLLLCDECILSMQLAEYSGCSPPC